MHRHYRARKVISTSWRPSSISSLSLVSSFTPSIISASSTKTEASEGNEIALTTGVPRESRAGPQKRHRTPKPLDILGARPDAISSGDVRPGETQPKDVL